MNDTLLNVSARRRTYVTHALDFDVFGVKVLFEFGQLIQVPPLLSETLTRISELHRRGSVAATHPPAKPWSKRYGSRGKDKIRA